MSSSIWEDPVFAQPGPSPASAAVQPSAAPAAAHAAFLWGLPGLGLGFRREEGSGCGVWDVPCGDHEEVDRHELIGVRRGDRALGGEMGGDVIGLIELLPLVLLVVDGGAALGRKVGVIGCADGERTRAVRLQSVHGALRRERAAQQALLGDVQVGCRGATLLLAAPGTAAASRLHLGETHRRRAWRRPPLSLTHSRR
eukprot:gene6502-biopygen233